MGLQAQTEIYDITVCGSAQCGGDCGNKIGLCQNMFLAPKANGATDTAKTMITTDTGATWTETGALPFAVGESVVSTICFYEDKNVKRIIVVRGTEVAATNPIEIAYSDDDGATWTSVDVEASGTRWAVDSGALFALDAKHIWLVSTDGYIFFSANGGISWTTQDAGLVTAGDYSAIHFANANDGFAVAASGVVVKTDDGGTTWVTVTAITGTPTVVSVYTFDENNVMVGDNGGDLWRSWDGGTTWTQIYTGVTSINDIAFINDFVGFICDGAFVLRTRNGGEDWERVTMPTGTVWNAIAGCDENTAYAVGANSAVGMVVKLA